MTTDLQYLRIDKAFYAAKDLARYRSDSGQDVGSMWSKVVFRGPFDGLTQTLPGPSAVGIDPALLPVPASEWSAVAHEPSGRTRRP